MATTTVTGTWLKPNGDPANGRVTLRLVAATYHDGLDAIFPQTPVTAVLDETGAISIELEPTSGVDADFDATDMTYEVIEKIAGAQRDPYYVDIPTAAGVDLGTLATYEEPQHVTRVLVDVDAAALGIPALIADHAAAVDPHTGYLTEVAANATYGAADYLISSTAMTADPSGALQAAVAALEAVRGGVIQLPRGTYALDETVIIEGAAQVDDWGSGGIEIRGAGMRGTRLTSPAADVAVQVGVSASKVSTAFRDLTLAGPGKASAGSIGIDSRTTGGSYTFDNVLVSDYEIGIRYYDNTLVHASSLNVRKCGTGLALGFYSDAHHYAACRIDQCDVGVDIGYMDAARSQVTPTESHATSFVNCLANQNGVSFYVRGSASESITLDTCYIEQYSDVGVRIGDAAGAGSVSATVELRNCFFNGDRQVAPIGKVDHAVEINNALNVRVRGGGFRNHLVTPINVRNVAARVTVEPASFSTASGETGSVKLHDGTVHTIGTDRPLNIGRVSNPVNVAASTPSASVAYDGAQLRVSQTTYECGPDGLGGYAWYEQPSAKRGSQLLTGSLQPSVFLGAGSLEAIDGSPTLTKVFFRWMAWSLADSVDSGVGSAFKVPTDWATIHVDLLWSKTDTGTGNVVYSLSLASCADGADLTATQVSNTPVIAVPTQNLLKVSRVLTGQAVTPSNVQHLRCYRSGSHASDTYTGTAQLLGLLVTKAS